MAKPALDEEEKTRRRHRLREIVLDSVPRTFLIVFVVSLLLGLAPFLLALAARRIEGGSLTIVSPNEFGDTFGFVNSLMSALAFAALVVALAMQNEELELQRKELKDSREQLEASAVAQKQTAQLNLVSNYLSSVATALDYYSAPGRSGRPRDNGKAAELVGSIDSMMDVLVERVREAIPAGDFRNAVSEMASCWVDVEEAWESSKESDADSVERLSTALRRCRSHLSWMPAKEENLGAIPLTEEMMRASDAYRSALNKLQRVTGDAFQPLTQRERTQSPQERKARAEKEVSISRKELEASFEAFASHPLIEDAMIG